MRALDPAIAEHLASGATTLATCWRLVRTDGVVLGFTDHDRSIVFDGVHYTPETGVSGSAMAASADLATDNAEFEGILSADALSSEDLAAGRFDGARVEIFRVNWRSPAQRVLLKAGLIGAVTRQGKGFTAELRGLTALLDQPKGRVYGRLCDVDLGGKACGVDLADPAYHAEGIVSATSDETRFVAAGFDGFSANWFANGYLQWIKGANAGLRADIKYQGASGAIDLWSPVGAPIAIGDEFQAKAGCDKRFETCREKFANSANFRGFHLMPGNDFAISYPLPGENNDGGKR